jgi:hypothetical protein
VDWEKISGEFKTLCWLFLLMLGTASFFLMEPPFTLGVILGGFLAIANFSALQYTIRRAFGADGRMKGKKTGILAKYYLRLFVLGLIIYILITRGWVDAMGLAVGLSVVVFGITTIGIRAALKMSSGEAM